jgi:hypothetical protein
MRIKWRLSKKSVLHCFSRKYHKSEHFFVRLKYWRNNTVVPHKPKTSKLRYVISLPRIIKLFHLFTYCLMQITNIRLWTFHLEKSCEKTLRIWKASIFSRFSSFGKFYKRCFFQYFTKWKLFCVINTIIGRLKEKVFGTPAEF